MEVAVTRHRRGAPLWVPAIVDTFSDHSREGTETLPYDNGLARQMAIVPPITPASRDVIPPQGGNDAITGWESFQRHPFDAGIHLARRVRSGLFRFLLCLPLLLGLATGAQAQVECSGGGPYEVPHDWTLKPSGVSSGDNFRLLFLTSATRNASATGIGTYNTFVQTRAKAGHSAITDSCGDQFKVVGSTSSVDARDNTSTTGTGEAIYWLNGAKVADNYADFYDRSWDSYASKNELGNANTSHITVFTGSDSDGTKVSGHHLGATNVRVGARNPAVHQGPISDGGDRTASNNRPFYALSPIFTVGAEPITVSISAPTDANEGDSGTTNKLFTVSLSSAHTAGVSVRVCYSGTATRGASADYQSRFSTAISTNSCATRLIATGSTGTNAYGIQIRGDTTVEPDETVIATLSLNNPPAGVVLGTSTATYTILDDDDTTAPGVTSIERHSPTDHFTNADSLTWRVTFSEAVRNVDTTDFSLVIAHTSVAFPGTTSLDVSSVSTSVYDITASGSGIENVLDNSIQLVFASGHNIEDLSGNALPASPTPTGTDDNSFTLDNTAPTVTSIERQSPTTAMTDEDSLTWRVTFDDTSGEAVVNVDTTDFSVTGTTATITSVSEHATNTFDVTASGGDLDSLTGTVTLSFANTHDITDDVGNALPASPTPTSGTNDNTFEVQNAEPTLSLSGPADANEGNSGTRDLDYTVSLSQALTGSDYVGFQICFTGTATIDLTEAATIPASADYQTVSNTNPLNTNCSPLGSFLPSGSLTKRGAIIRIKGDTDAESDETVIATLSITSQSGGITLGTSTHTHTILDDDDTTAPGVTSITRHSPTALHTNADSLTWQVTFSEAVRNVDTTDFSLVVATTSVAYPGTTALAVSQVSTSVYDITASGSGIENSDNPVQLKFDSSHDIEDLSSNALPASPTISGVNHAFLLDNTAPTVTSIERQSPTTSMTDEDSLTWRVTFADSGGTIANVDTADFQVTGTTATITSVSEHATNVFDVTASGGDLDSLTGTVTLSFANTHDITDEAGNALTDTTPTSGTNDNTFELQNVIDPDAPKVVSIHRYEQPVQGLGTSLVWRVRFNKHLPNVYASDFTLTGTTAGLDVRHDLSNYDPTTYKTIVHVYAQGGDLDTVSGAVTLNFASNHNIRDYEGRRLASTTPSGANQKTFTLDPNQTLIYFTQPEYYVNEGEDAVLTVKLSRLQETKTTIRLSATPLTATGNGIDYGGQTYEVIIPRRRSSGTFNIEITDKGGREEEENFRVDIHTFDLTGFATAPARGSSTLNAGTYIHILDKETADYHANRKPGLLFDTPSMQWNEADGCTSKSDGTGPGPSYQVKLEKQPLGPVEVWIKDPDDDYRSDPVATGRLYVANRRFLSRYLNEENDQVQKWKDDTHTVLHFTPDNWNTYQRVQVRIRCADHYTAQIPIVHRLYTNYTDDKGKLSHAYPGYTGVVNQTWSVQVRVHDSDPPIVVKGLPPEGQSIAIDEDGHQDFQMTLSPSAFAHESSLTVYLSARGGKAAGVKRRDGDAQSCGGPLDDCLIFTPSNRTQWVRVFAINPGLDQLKVEIPQLQWGDLYHVRDWEMTWPIQVLEGQNAPQNAPAESEQASYQPVTCVSDALLTDVTDYSNETWRSSVDHVERWSRVLAAFGVDNAYSNHPMTIDEAQAQADRGLQRWLPIVPALQCLENPPQEQPQVEEETIPPPTVPEISLSSGSAIDEGGTATFTVTADSAPQSDLTIGYTVSQSGDYLDAPGSGARTVTLVAGATTVSVAIGTVDDAADEVDGAVSVTVDTGNGYTIATHQDSASVPVRDNDEPVVRISAGSGITEGDSATFTVTAHPVPAVPLDMTVTVAQNGEFATSGETGSRTLTLPVTGSATFTVATLDDAVDEPDGSISATINTGAGYIVAEAPNHTASVTVSDNDVTLSSGPTLSIGDATLHENQRTGYFTITLSEAMQWPVTFYYATQDSNPVSARAGEDYIAWQRAWKLRSTINPGQTEKKIYVRLYNDNHDEDPETFQMVIYDAGVSGADATVAIADSTATGTIINDDPMPQAWLTRFGRTIAQQAIDGLSDRIADNRTAGTQGTVAGQAFTLGSRPAESVLSHSSIHSMDDDFAHSTDAVHDRHYFGGTQSQSYDMTVREALLNSSFTATGEKDATGGSVSFWGRATQGHFDGREGAFSLDGETTTALLGTDYAKDNWLVGLTLIQSDGEGRYTDTEPDTRTHSQLCTQQMSAQERSVLCEGAVREGDGEVEASLTAITPYASIQASDSIRLWGTLGQGSGEVTLQPELGDAIPSDMSWSMAAMGMRGDLLQQEQGLSLALTADALWSRTESDQTHALAASNASTTRIRAGLESSWKKNLANGQVTPRLEVGIRQDGGDAETGTGLEIGGGIAWQDTNLGLSLDLSGRTLVSHDSDDLEDRGVAASFTFDPEPQSQRGLSLTLNQDWGGQSTGGLDALFAEQSISERTGSASESRWNAQAAYGFSMLSGQFTGSPYIGTGITDSTQEYTLGWRLTPVHTTGKALNFTMDVKATHRETDDDEPTQFVGVEVGVRW